MKRIILLLLIITSISLKAQKYIVVNFAEPSSQERFKVYNENGTCYFSCKCAHGQGGKSTNSKPEFSNKVGSNCSSLGKFKIIGYYSKKNINYLRLEGINTTNSNAFKRGICIHNSKLVSIWKYIPFFNIPLSNASNGCFAIDNSSMNKLISLYKKGKLKYLYAINIIEI